MLQLAFVFLIMSGVASLTYQVTWVRLLGLSMGSTSAAVGTVLAAFFLGLAIGSYFAERITRNRIHSFAPYLWLELIIGVSGLALLPALLHLDQGLAYLPDAWASLLPVKFSLSIALLIIPTLCMGATFPVMASLMVRKQKEMGLRISQFYSMNTAGAVLGAALSGFVFIPAWGLNGAVYIAFSLNMLIVLMILLLRRRLVLPPVEETAATSLTNQTVDALYPKPRYQRQALAVLVGTGFVAIATEVGWTKYLVIFTGTTIYGFSAILTIFLLGIAAGSWAVRHRLQRMQDPAVWMAFGLLLLAASLLGTRAALSVIPNVYDAVNHLEAPGAVRGLVKYALVFVLLIAPTFLFGALFPINLKLYCGELSGLRQRIGFAYAANTLASIAGSIVAGFVIIPWLGTDWLLTLCILLIAVLPVLFIFSIKQTRGRVALLGAIPALAAGAIMFPHLDYKHLVTSVHYRFDDLTPTNAKPRFIYLGEGKTGIISAVTFDEQYAQLQNNGLKESVVVMKPGGERLMAESLLGLLPYLLQDEAQSAFVVGFGGGVTSETLTWTGLKSIRVVELEPKVVEAVSAISAPLPPPALRDSRVNVQYNDARNTLLVEDRTYDIIVSQPSHPWRAGAANLFTREFFHLAHTRLNEHGIYGQWLNLFNMDATTLRSVLKAFYQEFPYGMAYANIDSGDMILLGGRQSLRLDYPGVTERINKYEPIKDYMASIGVYEAYHLLWFFAFSRDELLALSAESVENSDLNILSEVRLSALDHQPPPDSPEDPYAFLTNNYTMDLWPYVPQAQAAQHVYDIGIMFLEFDSERTLGKIIKQLEQKAPALALALKYKAEVKKGDFIAAGKLFDANGDWPDDIVIEHIQLAMDLGDFAAARKLLPRLKDSSTFRAATAQMHYQLGERRVLEKWVAKSDAERKWQLAALARNKPGNSEAELQSLAGDNPEDIAVIQVLLSYSSGLGKDDVTGRLARLLVEKLDKQVARLEKFARTALDAQDTVHAKFLLDRIAVLKPDLESLSSLRKRLQDMHEEKLGAGLSDGDDRFGTVVVPDSNGLSSNIVGN